MAPWQKALAGVVVVGLLLALLVAFFPWDWLRAPLNRYITDRMGRHFEITRHLDVKLGRTATILADGIEFANPEWAHDPMLLKAEGAEIQVRLLPLLARRFELPLIALHKPQLSLQIEPDGRRSWALGRDTGDPLNLPQIGAFVVDEGSMHFVASNHGADIRTEFAVADGAELPLSFRSRGTWQKETFTAQGRTGNVLYLSEPLKNPFPIELQAAAGRTTLKAQGRIASLATLAGADAVVTVQGHDMADLYKLIGVVLPSTPRYALRATVSRQGEVWHARGIAGKLGNSDLAGELSFDRSQGRVPLLAGKVQSKSLDFDDLAPLVGLPEQPRSAAALPQVQGARAVPADARRAQPSRDPTRKVLPTATLDLPRLKAMDADVHYEAARVSHVRHWPIDRIKVHVFMKGGVLQLDPLDIGVAGGSLAGRLHLDSNRNPAAVKVNLDVRSLELGKMFPGAKLAQASFGKMHGDIDLAGRGNSVATMLGGSGGKVALLMGRGQVSNLLMELAGIDGGEIIKFMLRGDQNVNLRCAGAAFDVKQGVMASRALVFDTEDTVIYGDGQVSLADETIDLTLRPYPKDMSILSLRSPLKVAGRFASPRLGPDKGALTGKAAVVLALAAVNPLLGLAATVETGPGRDADCGTALREASSAYAAARVAAMNPPEAQNKAAQLGASPAQGSAAAQERKAAQPRPSDKDSAQNGP